MQRNPLPESPVPASGKTMLIRNKQGTKRIAVPSRPNPEPVTSPLPSSQRSVSLDYSNSGSSSNVAGKKKKKKKGRKSGQQHHGTPSGDDEGDEGRANNGYYGYSHADRPDSPQRQAHLYQQDITQSMAGYDDTDEVHGLVEGDGEGEEDDNDEFSDEDNDYPDHDGYSPPPSRPTTSLTASKKKNNKKKKKKASQDHNSAPAPAGLGHHRKGKDRIWNTSTAEERERIKDFWLSLGEEERRSLVKVEKEAVLKKMKEQQKHSCSCSVCGRKRTAIEEELEVLYDAYYEELEQYANQQQGSKYGNHVPTSPRNAYSHGQILGPPRPRNHFTSHHNDKPPPMDEIEDDEEYDEDDEEYEDEDEDDLDEPLPQNEPRPDFFNFGNSLTVQGGILTVADDLLKNDGKKFIEMMEQLAERRMAREEEANTSANGHMPSGLPMQQSHPVHDHVQPEYDDDEEYDDEEEEEDYDDEEEEDEPDTMTEEQRMEEGRRMFQIFAARMFEQRVLTAYREKVARERQSKLLEELEEESRRNQEREEKRAKEKDKKKERKRLQKQAKEEERLRKEAEKAAEEAKLKAAENQKAEEQRKRKEEQRLKREAERKTAEEERQRKEEEKRRRLQEEREREAERERKRKEHQERERKRKEQARQEKETREKEAREKREKEEKERRERETALKKEAAEKERRRKEDEAKAKAEAVAKRTVVSAPPAQPPSNNYGSPHLSVVTPAIPKQPVGASPSRPRNPSQQSSMQSSVGSSPKTPQVTLPIGTSASPGTPNLPHNIVSSSAIPMNKAFQFPSNATMPPTSPMVPIAPPPGVTLPPDTGFPGISPMGMNPPGSMHPFLPGMHQRPSLGNGIPGFPPPPIPMGPHPSFRGFASPNGMPMQIPPAPGMRGIPQQNRGVFMNDLPPPQQLPPGVPLQPPGSPFINRVDPMPVSSHSRAPSGSFDPLHRPTPIQRPSSVAPPLSQQNNIDEPPDVMGSRALLEDDDVDPLQENMSPSRRASSVQFAPRPTRGVPASSPLFSDAIGVTDFAPSWSHPAPLGTLPSSLPSAWGNGASSFNEHLNGYTNKPGWSDTDAARSSFNRRRPGRLDDLRTIASKICLEMGGNKSTGQSVEMATLQRAMQHASNSDLSEVKDLQELLTIEGDEVNGGGTFHINRDSHGRTLVQFEEEPGDPQNMLRVGEIGSPSMAGVSPVPFRTPLSPAFS